MKKVVFSESDDLDHLDTTIHFIAHIGDQYVGAARLLLPNQEVASANNLALGVSLEQQYRIVHGVGPSVLPAEVSRLCVLPELRRSRALLILFSEILRESRKRGVTHLLGAASLETSSAEDAAMAYTIARHQGLISLDWRMEPRALLAPTPSFPPSRYSLLQRLCALHGEFSELKLPPLLSLAVRKMGARIVGEPVYDPYMRVYALPIVAAVDSIPSELPVPPRPRQRPHGSRQPLNTGVSRHGAPCVVAWRHSRSGPRR